MAKFVVLIESNCSDPSREDAFNTWYNETHLPDVLETPGVVRAVRYQNLAPEEGQAKYLAAYEIEADDLEAVMQAVAANIEKKAAAGRMSDLLAMAPPRSFVQMYELAQG